jgi:ComF family protein
MINFFKTELWLSVLDICFPESCLGCGTVLKFRQDISFCQPCLHNVRLLQEPYCTLCGQPFAGAAGTNHLCGYCLRNTWYFTQARAAVWYQPPMTEAIKMFKYHSKMYGLATFGALAQQYFQQQPLQQHDLIVPVPLHIKRLRQRGFNQALVLCRKIFPASRDKIGARVLERHAWTQPQTGLSGPDRRRNVRNEFTLRRPEQIKNKRVLLVDDVFTTGATVNECARLLLKGQASRVDVFTFARVVA